MDIKLLHPPALMSHTLWIYLVGTSVKQSHSHNQGLVPKSEHVKKKSEEEKLFVEQLFSVNSASDF